MNQHHKACNELHRYKIKTKGCHRTLKGNVFAGVYQDFNWQRYIPDGYFYFKGNVFGVVEIIDSHPIKLHHYEYWSDMADGLFHEVKEDLNLLVFDCSLNLIQFYDQSLLESLWSSIITYDDPYNKASAKRRCLSDIVLAGTRCSVEHFGHAGKHVSHIIPSIEKRICLNER